MEKQQGKLLKDVIGFVKKVKKIYGMTGDTVTISNKMDNMYLVKNGKDIFPVNERYIEILE